MTALPLHQTSLCVVGNINRDLRTSPLAPGAHLLQDGETAVGMIRETVGGGGANSALAAAALGAQVSFCGKVGKDELGTKLENTLRHRGVTPYLAHDEGCRTGTSIALSHPDGQRHFVSWLPNNRALRLEDLDSSILPHYRHLLRADIWFSEDMLYGGNARLFATARAMNVTISLDLNWDPCWGVGKLEEIQKRKEAVRALLPNVALAHGNRRELTEFAETSDLSQALKRISEWGAEAIVVHLGSEGAAFYRDGKLTTAPAVPARRHLNTTGTGDLLSVGMMLCQQLDSTAVLDQLTYCNRLVTDFIEGEGNYGLAELV